MAISKLRLMSILQSLGSDDQIQGPYDNMLPEPVPSNPTSPRGHLNPWDVPKLRERPFELPQTDLPSSRRMTGGVVPPMGDSSGGALNRIGSDEEDDIPPYEAETTDIDRFRKLLGEFPERESPSILRRIAASGIAINHGYKGAKEVLDEPYDRKLTEWKEKTGPYQQAANLERYSNVNNRNIYTSAKSNQIAGRKIDETTRHNQETEKIAQEKNDINRAHQEGYTFHNVNGHLIATAEDGSSFDTGNDPNNYSAFELARLGHKYRTEEIITRGEQTRQTNEERPLTPNNEKVNRSQILQEVYDTDRAGLGRFVKRNRDGTFELNPPSGGMFGGKVPPEELAAFEELKRKVYPNYSGGGPSTGGGGGGRQAPQYQRNEETGEVRVSYDGRKTWESVSSDESVPTNTGPRQVNQTGPKPNIPRGAHAAAKGQPEAPEKEVHVIEIATGKSRLMRESQARLAVGSHRFRWPRGGE